jgi:hypothetical protein
MLMSGCDEIDKLDSSSINASINSEFTISSVHPASESVGAKVTLLGGVFMDGITIQVDGINALVHSITSESMEFSIPKVEPGLNLVTAIQGDSNYEFSFMVLNADGSVPTKVETSDVNDVDQEESEGSTSEEIEPETVDLSLITGEQSINENDNVRFGVVVNSADEENRTFTLSNNGNSPATIEDINLSGDEPDSFSLSNLPNSPIQPGESHTFEISFAPRSISGRKTANVNIYGDEDVEFHFTVSGTSEWGRKFLDGGDIVNGANYNFTKPIEAPEFTEHNGRLFLFWNEKNWNFNTRAAVVSEDIENPSLNFVDNDLYGLNFDDTGESFYPHGVSCNGKLYVTWAEKVGINSKRQIRISTYNDNDQNPVWTFVDGNATNGINADVSYDGNYPRLACHKSTLYSLYNLNTYSNVYNLRFASYNGDDASPSWAVLDSATAGLNFNPDNGSGIASTATFNNKFVIGWTETTGVSGSKTSRVNISALNEDNGNLHRIDGANTKGLNFISGTNAGIVTLKVFEAELYAFWFEEIGGGNESLRVVGKKFNGDFAAPAWTSVGESISGPSVDRSGSMGMDRIKAAEYKGNLYLSYSQVKSGDTNDTMSVTVLNTNTSPPSWHDVTGSGEGINRDSTQNAFNGDMISFHDRLYLTWYERGLYWDGGETDQLRISTLDD